MSALAATNISVRRGARDILSGISLTIARGSLTAIIGPNGAGKSTLMSVLAGLIAPDSGEVRLDGAPLASVGRQALAKKRAYLPQNARSEWPLTVERVVALGLTPILPAFGGLTANATARIAETLAAYDLAALRDQAVTTLSGGELARAMLARAVVGDAPIVMADEPTTGLDPRHALDAMTRLRALADAGRTVIVAIHDLAVALPFADHVIALADGKLFGDIPAAAIDDAFLSRLYDVEARIVRDDDGLTVRFLGRR